MASAGKSYRVVRLSGFHQADNQNRLPDYMNRIIRRALISVSDKRGIVDFARSLNLLGIEILSTGGTAGLLSAQGIPMVEVGDYTGFPEMMDGRVKTLHPRIYGGILGRRGIDDDAMQSHKIRPIDLVVVNLYPFQQAISTPDCTLDSAIGNIDIGGPTLLRAAAKNFNDVTVVVDLDDYATILAELDRHHGCISPGLRFNLSVKAFEHTAAYDGVVANYLGGLVDSDVDANVKTRFPRTFNQQYYKQQTMRYGENPHQHAAFYVNRHHAAASVANAVQTQGKALSYNNIADTDAGLECVRQFAHGAACVIVKHANPCGVAADDSQLQAYQRAHSTDAESAFGGIIAFNTPLEAATAAKIIDQQFVEVIAAPEITADAKTILAGKQNLRVLESGFWEGGHTGRSMDSDQFISNERLDYKKVSGGLLVQDVDTPLFKTLEVVTRRTPEEGEMQDLLFAWKVAKFVKSNAIVFALNQMTIGIGAGQMSRVNSARIAAIKAEQAGFGMRGAVMASDAFLPFRDGLDNAASVGIRAVIQPGGSVRDDEVIAAADAHDMAMIHTGMRHFRH